MYASVGFSFESHEGPIAHQSLIPLTIYDIKDSLQKYRLIGLRQRGRISGVDVN
jgi:hypothetical protein